MLLFCYLVRYLNHLSDEIFSYLDYGSLKNSEMVSPVWYESIISGNMWKKLLQRNVRHNKIFNTFLIAVTG